MVRLFARLHDAVSAASAAAGGACVGAIACAYCYEVASRYFFGAPTVWVNTVTTYLLLAGVSLMGPYVAQQGSHVSIPLLIDALPERRARQVRIVLALLAAAACAIGGFVVLTEGLAQFRSGVVTIDPLQVPKWWFMALLGYALVSSALHFIRSAVYPVYPASP